MGKNVQYYTEKYKALKQTLNDNRNFLDKSIQNAIEEKLSLYETVFKGDKNAVDYLKNNSAELKDLFDKIEESFNVLNGEAKKFAKETENLLGENTLEDLDKAISSYEKVKEIKREIKALESKKGTDEKLNDEIDKQIVLLESKKESLEKSYSSKFKNEELDGEIERRENINKKIKEQVNLQKIANDLDEERNELSEEHIENVAEFKTIAKDAWGVVVSIAKAGFEKWKEIDEQVFTVGRHIGLSSNQLIDYQENVLNNYDGLASRLGMTFSELFKFQEQYTKNTGRAIVLSNEQVESLGTMSKLVGEVATNEMVKNMDDFGASTETATSYLALNMARARSQGLDAQKASELFANNVKLASKYTFSEGVNGISKMTLLSQKLKFNMDSIANAAEKFETVEGAIGTAANLQMLGGSFSSQFGNPLEAMNMAMLDMESFTNKIIDTFSGKATFNRETGQVEMSAIDKRFLKEAAKQLGIAYDEVWNMASQQAKISDVERQLMNNTENFTEEEKAWITSNSQYNAETKQHTVTFFQDGEQKTLAVENLTKQQLDIVRKQEITDKAIQGDVQGIHSILKAYAKKEMGDSKSWNEMQKGWQETAEINVANIEDWLLESIKNYPLKFMTDENWWIAKLGLIGGTAIVGGLIKKYIGRIFEVNISSMGGSISQYMTNFKNLFKGRGQNSSTLNASGGFKNFFKNFKLGKKTKITLAIGAATALAGTLMSADDGSKIDKSKLGGREVEPNDVNTNELEQTSVIKTEELTELQKQTALLTLIANNQGVDVNQITNNSTISSDNVKDNSVLSIDNIDSTISSVGDTTLMAAQTKVGKKGLAAIGKKITGESVAKSVVKGVPKGGALGLGSLAVDLVNMGGQSLDLWEEGSHTDKLMNIGSKGLEYAGYGALIGSVILALGTTVGAAVGGVIGTAVGTFQQYGEEIKEFGSKVYNGVKEGLFGSDNMTEADKAQQRYEETKIGFVDIRDPQLQQKAYLATCQIHDIVVSMWHHMNGRQSNGLEEEKGLFGGLFSSSNVSKTTSSTSYNSNHNTVSSNEILSKPTVGEPTYIRENANYISPSYYNNLNHNNKLDLNVSGTIKLTTENGNSTEIDMNKLLNNTQFMNSLVEMIGKRFSSLSNQGGRVEKSSVGAIMHYGYGRESLNGN